MEELKIGGKAEVGYMGGSKWTGVNATDGYLRYSDINKLVKKAFRMKYPNVEVSCTGSSFSGGQECNGTIYLPLEELIVSYDEFLKTDYCPTHQGWYEIDGKCIWGESPELTNEMRMKATYDSYKKHLCDWSGVRINTFHICDGIDRKILKPKAMEMVEYLNALYDSFNKYDVNGMVDYFDVSFYKDVSIKALN